MSLSPHQSRRQPTQPAAARQSHLSPPSFQRKPESIPPGETPPQPSHPTAATPSVPKPGGSTFYRNSDLSSSRPIVIPTALSSFRRKPESILPGETPPQPSHPTVATPAFPNQAVQLSIVIPTCHRPALSSSRPPYRHSGASRNLSFPERRLPDQATRKATRPARPHHIVALAGLPPRLCRIPPQCP